MEISKEIGLSAYLFIVCLSATAQQSMKVIAV